MRDRGNIAKHSVLGEFWEVIIIVILARYQKITRRLCWLHEDSDSLVDSTRMVWLGLYWPLLTGHVPAFRDAFHFYYPLEHWLDQQARQGELFPTFNPFDATGANLAGEMSTGLFYPGRILWWLPALSVAQRLGVVLLTHTCIAGVGAAYAARRMQLGRGSGSSGRRL